VSLSDTVGFIRDLPHKLVEAFEATLQEAAEADLLLHIVDAASPVLDEQVAEVERVLRDIGADGIAQILVYNKLDNLPESQRPLVASDVLELDGGVRVPRVFVSALQGTGLTELRRLLSAAVAGTPAADLNLAEMASSPASLEEIPDEHLDSAHRRQL
jgi:GTP-binding protein HflX